MVAVETKRVGGSLMVRIPKKLAETYHISEGDFVDVEVRKLRKDLFGAFPELKLWNKEEDRARSKYE